MADVAPTTPIEAQRFADLCFLVVEDREAHRKSLGQLLAGLGAKRVYEAADGQAALEILGTVDSRVDVIVSDLDMPGMDGMEFIRHVGERSVPGSMIVASALHRSLIEAVEAMTMAYGVKLLGVIEKPVTAQKLESAFQPRPPAKLQPREARPLSLVEMTGSKPIFNLEEITNGLKSGEFEPFFQPMVEVSTRRIVGARALARWRHPEMGKVEPDVFIKPLEDSGRIDELTWEMVRKAAACCSVWRAAGLDFTISVRLAVGSLAGIGLADRLTELVYGRDLDPQHMVLEVTDAAVATLAANAMENLARLRMMGFGLSIGDYGTGGSPVQQLTRADFTEIKVDQAYVRHMSTDESSKDLLFKALETARTRGIALVGIGAETQLDWDVLVDTGCKFALGYFVAAPMEAGAFLNWARGRSHWIPAPKPEKGP